MAYREGLNYLASKTRVIELCNQLGGRIAICPDWNGRVMTSTCDGLDGYSFGLINVPEINKTSNPHNTHSEKFGGEDQFTFSPNSGLFQLHNTHSDTKTHTADELNHTDEKFIIDSEPPDPEIRMRRFVSMINSVGTRFDCDVIRVVRLLDVGEVGMIFGQAAAMSIEQTDTSYVAFQTSNVLVNRGLPLRKSTGLVSIQIRNMLNTGIDSVAVIPFRSGDELGFGVGYCVDFFDLAPHSRLRQLQRAVLIRGDSRYPCQVGISRKRATPYLGSLDFRHGNLTLISFNLPESAWTYDYMSNNFCELDNFDNFDNFQENESGEISSADFVCVRNNPAYLAQQKIAQENLNNNFSDAEYANYIDDLSSFYAGEVVRVCNRGSLDGDDTLFRYCEFDVFSPAKSLQKGESIAHQQYTLHINADNQTLAFIAQEVLGVNYEQTFEKMLK